ncbi:serine hydrolase [Fluoribacter gormanii]|uniref:CubicO group peptidase, beta-lactamase class C family n=1 Tax=Fluoribacter gormanii TaxID=464 RepID=A0A377GL89_9GAMM|nr:serine hydrolase [Fluoribacter gormanii]KTD04961.1 beta-lactamase [Fluoribacter gormanii]SIR54606.1 CubicO group peptidase, beta-lactamase class C family [Fluoribacter gormanii]STO25590.1 Penicillin-binding protein E [Fluoribacter gormanii]
MNTHSGSGRGDIHTLYRGQSVDNLIIEYMEENNIPGMSLAIVQAPYITRVVGYGFADTEKKRLVSTRTLFHVGQLTHAFTAVAIMQLIEEGKLQLDDSISASLSYLPQAWQDVTIRQLLTHSSGIPDYSECEGFYFHKDYKPEEIFSLIQDPNLLFTSGTKMQPSASNYYLLGIIIENISGMSYEAYVTKNQIERVGLKRTFFIKNTSSIDNEVHNGTNPFKHSEFLHNPSYIDPVEVAVGYKTDNKAAPELTWTTTFAHIGIVASAEDISLWDISLAGTILVRETENRDFLYHCITLNNKTVIPGNAGWLFPGHPGLMEIKGNIPGFSAFLSRFTAPNELLCVTLLANKENLFDLDILGRKIAAAFDIKLAAPAGPGSQTLQSPYSVSQTIERITNMIAQKGGKIFAHIDHSSEAKKVNQSLLPTEVLIIGNPEKGTPLMQENAAVALDLPLRIMATEDQSGQVWLSFTDPIELGKEYHLHDNQLKQIATALRILCEKAVSAQSII